MANRLYPKGKDALFDGDIDWLNDTIMAVLIDTNDVTYNAAHDFLNDIAAGVVGTAAALTSKTRSSGVCDAADVTFSAVTGDPAEAIVLYKHNASNSAAQLIAWIDSASAGLPVTPNGTDITIAWHASGILALPDAA